MSLTEEKITVVHNYLKRCRTNDHPPGLADFLRGTITLYILSKRYGFDLKINTSSHPLFQFLNVPHEISLEEVVNEDKVEEFIPSWPRNRNYEEIYNNLLTFFSSLINSNSSSYHHHLLTNSFYRCVVREEDENKEYEEGCICNFGKAPKDAIDFVRKILTPSEDFKNYFYETLNNEGIPIENDFDVIHFRFGDSFLLNPDHFDENVFTKAILDIQNIVLNSSSSLSFEKNFIFICDSKRLGEEISSRLSETYKRVYHRSSSSKKVHTGSAGCREDAVEGIKDTLVDLFLMSLSEKIWAYPSGFSIISSIIFKKELVFV